MDGDGLDRESIWDDLARSAMHGGLVPFLGAGISAQSRTPCDETFRPDVRWLLRRLRVRYRAVPKSERPKELAAVATSNFAALDRLAELVGWLIGYEDVVRAVDLALFTRLNTLPGHRYIARMAREGWVREVIMTNYDDCLERAYRATYRHVRPSREDDQEPLQPAVIVDGADYRRLGAPRSVDGQGREHEANLRVFKINGCAARWVRKGRPGGSNMAAEAELILLADPQLASPNTTWKADLLRDRMRSRTLVYSGFGAEEGQIRYTHLAVEGEHGTGMKAPAFGPVVHVFESDATFPQLQLLAQKREGKRNRPDTARLITGRHTWRSSENDKADWETGGDKLSSDTFWRVAYRKAMVAAVIAHLHTPRGAFRQWLAGHGHGHGGPWVHLLAHWLKRVDEGQTACRPFDEVGPSVRSLGVQVQVLLALARGDDLDATHGLRDTQEHTYCEPYRPFQHDAEALCKVLLVLCLAEQSSEAERMCVDRKREDHDQAAELALGIVPVWLHGVHYRALLVDSSCKMDLRRLEPLQPVSACGEPVRWPAPPALVLDLADPVDGDRGTASVAVEFVTGRSGDDVRHKRLLQLSCVSLSQIMGCHATGRRASLERAGAPRAAVSHREVGP